MPTAAIHFWGLRIKVATLPRPQLFIIGAGVVLILVAAGSAAMASAQTPSAHSTQAPLYPSAQTTVPMIDASQYTVAQVIEKVSLATGFEMLAYNGGVTSELQGAGPYTVFVPASNYFDYLPRSAYVGLTHAQMGEIASHMIVQGEAMPLDESYKGSYLTLAGDEINFTPRDSDQSAAVSDFGSEGYVIRGYKASNGVVYITNKVLVPDDLQQALQ